MKVKEVMIPTSVACCKTAKLREACGALLESRWGFLPVVGEDGKFCGALTEENLRDILNREGVSIYELTVEESANQDLATCSPEDSLYQTLLCMHEKNLRQMAVTDSAGRVLGILSMDAILQWCSVGGSWRSASAQHEFHQPHYGAPRLRGFRTSPGR